MAKFGDGGDLLKCSFCGKSQKQVKKLIAGPGVYICDECIDLCNEIMRMRIQLEEILAAHTGQTVEQVKLDIERDRILTAAQAKDYGIVDEVISNRELAAVGVPAGVS